MNELLIPILLSSAACLAISVLAWRVLPLHALEHRPLYSESELISALRRDMPAPGIYSFPYRGPHGILTERADVAANLARGPVGYIIVGKPGVQPVAVPIVQHFFYFVLVATLTGYIASISGIKHGDNYTAVFRIVATVSTMALVLGAAPLSIWFSRPWKSLVLQSVDGLACGLASGAIFASFWPI
jgi:hypothetical protein